MTERNKGVALLCVFEFFGRLCRLPWLIQPALLHGSQEHGRSLSATVLIRTHGTQGKDAAIVWTGKDPAPPHKPLSRGVYAAGEYTSSACVFDNPIQMCQAHTSHSALPIGGQLLAPTTQKRSMPDVGWPSTAEHSEGRDEESCWKPHLILPWLKNSPAHTQGHPTQRTR